VVYVVIADLCGDRTRISNTAGLSGGKVLKSFLLLLLLLLLPYK
jgi:hypothetical protein